MNERSWTYKVPFQYAWRAAEALETRLDPENAEAFLNNEFSSICRVRIGLSAPYVDKGATRVTAWQLYASCPFCDAGNDQLLQSNHWIDVFKWDDDMEIDLQKGGAPRSGSYFGHKVMCELGIANVMNWQFVSGALRAWGTRACQQFDPKDACGGLLVPQRDYSGERPESSENIYGVSLSEALEALIEDDTIKANACEEDPGEISHQVIAREFGIEGYLGGLYRCAHCGNVFAVVFRDPHDATREGRYRLMPYISNVIDELLEREAQWEEEMHTDDSSSMGVPTMSVQVSHDKKLIRLGANIAGENHELVFDTEQGGFLLDGEAYVMEGRHVHLDVGGLHDNPFIHDCLSALPGLASKVLEMLPALPPDVDVSPARLSGWMKCINLLVAANRFVGYPAAFYDEMMLSGSVWLSSFGLAETYPFDTGLPRDYSEVDVLYKQAGLPEDERLKRVLMERPQALLDIMQRPEMPFKSVDILARFYQLPRLAYCMRMLCFHPKSIDGWRRLVAIKGEEAVFSYIEEQGMREPISSNHSYFMEFSEITCLFDQIADSITDEQLANLNMDTLYEDLEKLIES